MLDDIARARPRRPSRIPGIVGSLVMLFVILSCLWFLENAHWDRLPGLPGNLWGFAERMAEGVFASPWDTPPEQREGVTYADWWVTAFDKTIESVQIAWIGTCVGAMLSFPLAFLAANNTAPLAVRTTIRTLFNVFRAIPELIIAVIIMLPIFGITQYAAVAGAMALGIHSIGSLGKLTLEVIEGIDGGPIEAVRASGATWWQTIRVAVVPQMLPETVAFWLYRFEVNIRAGVILGAVGAGGVGSLLTQLFRVGQWDRIGITLLVIIVVTVIVDQTSAAVRHRIIHGGARAAEPRETNEPDPVAVGV